MSDPYLDKLDAQRALWRSEMKDCPLCLANPDSRAPLVDHIWDHREELSLQQIDTPQSDANIEYDHDAPADHYPYKSKGMDDAASMHPSKWRGRKECEALPGAYAKDEEPESEEELCQALNKRLPNKTPCPNCGQLMRLWSYHVARCPGKPKENESK